jgi:acyl carrier protein
MRFNEVKAILADVLNIDGGGAELQATTQLLGNLPELDSMAVVTLIGALEDHFGIVIEDDEISASTFETVGSLSAFVEAKLAR